MRTPVKVFSPAAPPPMGRALLARAVAERAGLPRAQVERQLSIALAQLAAQLAAGRPVQIRGLGSLACLGQDRRRVVFRLGRALRAVMARRQG